MRKALLITTNAFPSDTAMYVRYINLTRLLQTNGFKVDVISRGKYTKHKMQGHEGIEYFSVSGRWNTKLQRVFDYGVGMIYYVRKFLNTGNYDLVVLTAAPTIMLKYLLKYKQKHNIILLYNGVEWYSVEQFLKGKNDREYRKINYWMKKGITKDFGVISISKYLQNHFEGRKIKSVRIPVIMDVKNTDFVKKISEEKIVLQYAGAPGKKDFLKEIIEGCALLENQELQKVELRIIGIEKTQLVDLCDVSVNAISKLGDSLKMMGRIPREEVLKQLRTADFTVLLRSPDLRYAKAGFPTKVVESLAGATPVILNVTSDLGDYIHDGKEGIVIEECSAESFSRGVRKALILSVEERETMQDYARKCAERNFDYRVYKSTIKELL